MQDIGDLAVFGFRIGPAEPEQQTRDVAVLINGEDLTPEDPAVYLPTFIGQLADTATVLERRIDYVKHDSLFSGLSVTEIHNSLLHNTPDIFATESEWWRVREYHRFADWGETTDNFTAFLIPYFGRLYLTCQSRDRSVVDYDILSSMTGVHVTPYYLISTIKAAIEALMKEA